MWLASSVSIITSPAAFSGRSPKLQGLDCLVFGGAATEIGNSE
jgi:hypothetical protein